MYCQNCGKYLPDTAKFCDDCGTAASLGGKFKKTRAEVSPDPDHKEEPKNIPRKVGPIRAILLFFKNYFNFKGYATYIEEVSVKAFHMMAFVAIFMIIYAMGYDLEPSHPDAESLPVGIAIYMCVISVYCLFVIIPTISLAVRRHNYKKKFGDDDKKKKFKNEVKRRLFGVNNKNTNPRNVPRNVGFFGAIGLYSKNMFNFSGRSTKSELGYGILFVILLNAFFVLMIFLLDVSIAMIVMFIYYFSFIFVSIIPLISLIVRRLHDAGKSGAYLLTVIIFPILIMLLCKPSAPGNKWGPSADETEQMYKK